MRGQARVAWYEPGRRSGGWLKHKHRRRETFAVTGWRSAGVHARRHDAILVARTRPDGTLAPAGSAELGLSSDEGDQLRAALDDRFVATGEGSRRVASGILVDVDYHGEPSGPLRDAVMRTLRGVA